MGQSDEPVVQLGCGCEQVSAQPGMVQREAQHGTSRKAVAGVREQGDGVPASHRRVMPRPIHLAARGEGGPGRAAPGRRVRSLVGLVPKPKKIIVYTDFEDQLGAATEVTLSGAPVGTDLQRFEAKVRVYLRAHEDHVALQKLRRNRPLTPDDLAELERMLTESGPGDLPHLERAAEHAQGLGVFIRGLVGLDRDAATDALSSFIAGRVLNASQLDFVNLIITYLTEHGVMGIGRLCDAPFTDHAPAGPEALFSGVDIDALVAVLDQVRSSASPGVAS